MASSLANLINGLPLSHEDRLTALFHVGTLEGRVARLEHTLRLVEPFIGWTNGHPAVVNKMRQAVQDVLIDINCDG